MSAPERPGAPRGDDDSWGKLASDLFGIKLDEDEDLDISDLVPPVVVPASPPPVTPPPPAAAESVREIDLADMDFESDEEDDDAEEDAFTASDENRESTPTAEADEFSEANNEEEEAELEESPTAEKDDFWDALESWDWEPGEESESADAGRPPRSPGGRDRRPRERDRGDSRRGDRSEERGPRRERTPEREGRPPKSENRDRGESRPRRERRVEAGDEAARPARSHQPSAPDDNVRDDEFGVGLVEEAQGGKQASYRGELPAAERRAERPPEREELLEEEFARELLEEEVEPRDATEGEEGAEPSRPRRRRRRRRRRSGEDRETQVRSGDEETGEFPARDLEPGDERFEEGATSAEPAEEMPEPSRESSRGERGGRRRRRRPEGRPPRTEPAARSEEADFGESEDAWDNGEEERVVATRYDDIPTWEDAIACLLKPRADGGHRSGPPRRRG